MYRVKNKTTIEHIATAIPMIFLIKAAVTYQLKLLEFKNYTHGFGCFNDFINASIAISLVFAGFIILDYFTNIKYWKCIWIAMQLGILTYTGYIASIYYEYTNDWDIEKHGKIQISCSMSEKFILIVSFSLLLFAYIVFSCNRIRKRI